MRSRLFTLSFFVLFSALLLFVLGKAGTVYAPAVSSPTAVTEQLRENNEGAAVIPIGARDMPGTIETPEGGGVTFDKSPDVRAVVLPDVSTATTERFVHVPSAKTIAPVDTSPAERVQLQAPSDRPLRPEFIRERTNLERGIAGLPPLTHSDALASMAMAKVEDMITKQYFAHVSPAGVDIAGLAEASGYAYLRIGENLALGNFTSSEHVVTGWMNSPGHRANILNTGYTEIGVAVKQGRYEGDLVWFAVQEFGRPLSDCPAPDRLLEKKIEIYNEQLAKLEVTLENIKRELEQSGVSQEQYNVKANDFNTIAALYNSLLPIVQTAIETYNAQAKTFNSCVSAES